MVAQERSKWMMVTIHNPVEFVCQRLNRDLWSNEIVISLVKESFIFMQFNSSSHQGREHKTYYPFDETFPYICIIDPLTGELVWKSHTVSDPEDFFSQVMEFLESHQMHAMPKPVSKSSSASGFDRQVIVIDDVEPETPEQSTDF